MIRQAAIAAAVALTAGVQEPPPRFAVAGCQVRVFFVTPAEVERLCDRPADIPDSAVVLACYSGRIRAVIMPNPWECGSAERCAVLMRHEIAHACAKWDHEPL